MECIPPKQPIRVWDSQFIRKYLSLRCYSKKSLKTFARLKYGLWKVWNYERGNFFGKSIFRLGKMLTSVKIEHLNSSIKNSEFRFRLIAVPFVKDSKIQERRNEKRLLSKMVRTWLWLNQTCIQVQLSKATIQVKRSWSTGRKTVASHTIPWKSLLTFEFEI